MPEAAVREQARECTVCPSWTVACVHWDGQILWLNDERAPGIVEAMVGYHDEHGDEARFAVGLGTAVEPCICSPGHLVLNIPGESFIEFSNLPAAQTEFLRRAELLRLGGGDG